MRRSILPTGEKALPTLVLALLLPLTGCDGGTPAEPPPATVVRELDPLPGSALAPVATTVRVEFSAPVSLGGAALVLTRGSDTIAGALAQPATTAAVFTPAEILDLGTTYTATLRGVEGTNGLPVRDTSWVFTTAGSTLALPDGGRAFADLRALAHDSMGGRGSGTEDEMRAASFIRDRMQQAGLASLNGQQWLQFFTAAGLSSQNVYGALPGSGSLAAEWVVIGAHYDHLGETSAGVFNGADDNASGTALMLELSRLLAAHVETGGFGTQPRRSVLFVAFGAEEAGLLGSNYFCANPLVPLSAVAGMINLDMVGRLRNGAVQASVNTPPGDWVGLLERYRGELVVSTSTSLAGTDYRCFLQQGRPAVSLFTGFHPDYHRTTDDAGLINVPGVVQVGGLALGLAAELMLRPEPMALGATLRD